MERYAVLIDLSAIRIGAGMFRKLYADLTENGSVEYIKFYNYNTKRHREFRTLIKEYNIDVALSLAGKKRVRVDIREVIDAVRIASTCNNVTTIFLICGEVDGEHLISAIKKAGKFVTLGVTSPSTLSKEAHNVYVLDRMEEVKGVVKGDADSIFPYSDIESADISLKMREIDNKIIAAINSQKGNNNLAKLFKSDYDKNIKNDA